ncbi:hypothetical protein PAPYR_1103 [Paratrimastix pyriformis]|uniref:Uncharacterized protein n=1 Tax=Paratrimastix pyriformis TaxID=342808 RepID=A0ABQ8UTJ6_9EUKA|nr:hypothetical protein PAPYR_1103 [Paratrimastix pyriformis]
MLYAAETYVNRCKELGVAPIQSFYERAGAVEVADGTYTISPVQFPVMPLTPPQFNAMLDSMRVMHTLTRLIITGIDPSLWTQPCAEALAGVLDRNTCLRTLDLHGSHLGDPEGLVIAGALATNGSLRVLDLSDCDFGPMVLQKCAKALVSNQTLVSLDLSRNPGLARSPFVSPALGAALSVNRTLTRLRLSCASSSMRTLFRAIQRSEVTSLALCHAQLPFGTLSALALALVPPLSPCRPKVPNENEKGEERTPPRMSGLWKTLCGEAFPTRRWVKRCPERSPRPSL